jgi:hypothetical protein
MQSGNSVLCLLSSPFLYAIIGTFIIGTKLLKTADIKEFIRLKTIKLIDNQKVAKRDAHMLNLAHIMFSDSLPYNILLPPHQNAPH